MKKMIVAMLVLGGVSAAHAGSLNVQGNVTVASNLTAGATVVKGSLTLTNTIAGSVAARAAIRFGPNTGENGIPCGVTFYQGLPEIPSLTMWGQAAHSTLIGGGVNNDAYRRFRVACGGTLQWGSGTTAADTWLYRAASNSLATAGTLSAGDAVFSGNVTVNGKLDLAGMIDPPSLLLDAVTRAKIARQSTREIAPEKRDGALLFFNVETKRLEVYLPREGGFYDLNGKLLEKIVPPTLVGQSITNYFLDSETGEVVPQVSYSVPRWQLKPGYRLVRETGKFEYVSHVGEETIIRPATKAEAVELRP